MNKTIWFRKLFWIELFSPRGLLVRALVLALAFGVCELAGLREHTTFLSGTTVPDSDWQWSVVWGVTYILAYLGFVVAAPVLLITAALLAIWNKWVLRVSKVAAEDACSE